MRSLFILFLYCVSLFSLEIVINTAKENNQIFEILHIKDNQPFSCIKIRENIERYYYQCSIQKSIKYKEYVKKSRFFKIFFKHNQNSFIFKIEPKYNSKLIPVYTDLSKSKEIFSYKKSFYKHWQIAGFKKSLSYLKESKKEGINFPVEYEYLLTPFVGALDTSSKPINYDNKRDIKPYLELKKLFDEKGYESVIKQVDFIRKKEPDSLFKSEILLLKMRAIDKFLSCPDVKKSDMKVSYNDLEKIAKKWIKAYPSDQNLPEVLMLLSKAYLHIGLKKNALYYLNVLTGEYKESKFTQLGKIYLADTFAEARKKKALEIYKEVFFNTKDISVASLAADRIAWLYFDLKKFKDAKEYFDKIIKANPDYYLQDRVNAYNIAQKLAANGLESVAAKIAEKLIKKISKKDMIYEELFKNRAYWTDRGGDKQKAYKYYKEYLKRYHYGEYSDFVKERLDLLVFDKKDGNITKTLKQYDYIIKNYTKDKDVQDRAVIEKAKLLLELKRYDEVLKMERTLKSIKKREKESADIIKEAAYKNTVLNLKKNSCKKADFLIDKYKVKLKKDQDKKLFQCYMKLGKYQNAYKIFKRNKNSKDLREKEKWLYLGIKILSKLHYFDKAAELCADLKTLQKILKSDRYKELSYLCFNIISKTGSFEEKLSAVKEIEKRFPNSFKNIDPFYEIARSAFAKKSDLIAKQFSKKIIDLQNRYRIYTLTPKIEFIYIDTLKRLNENKKAYKATQNLLNRKIGKKQKARALYILAELALKLDKRREAKSLFRQCSDLNVTSSWQTLCKDNLSLLD